MPRSSCLSKEIYNHKNVNIIQSEVTLYFACPFTNESKLIRRINFISVLLSLTEHDLGSVQEQTVACKCLDYTYDCCTNRVYNEIIECRSYVRIHSRPSPFVPRKKDKYNTVRPEFFY